MCMSSKIKQFSECVKTILNKCLIIKCYAPCLTIICCTVKVGIHDSSVKKEKEAKDSYLDFS